MVPMYKKGGKKSSKKKSSFMEESKEITFGNKPMMKGYGGMKYGDGGFDLNKDGKTTFADVLEGRGVNKKKQTGGSKGSPVNTTFTPAPKSKSDKNKAFEQIKDKYQSSMPKSGTPISDQGMGYKKDGNKNTLANTLKKKQTGGKSMEPGGGGRFAKMVSKLKGEGKSEDSAKAIAASIGRKKYGKSKFQEMAAKGKKGLGGMSDSTSANDAGMEMMEAMGPKKPKKGSSGTRDTGPNVKRTKKARKNIGKCNRGEICFD